MSASVVAVTFDFWDTLVVAQTEKTRASRRAAMLDVLAEHGHDDIPEAMLDAVFDDTVRAFNDAWASNRQFTARDGAEHVVARLGRDLSPATRAALIEAFMAAGDRVDVELAPNVASTLAALDNAGIRIGIICDVGMTPSTVLRSYLERHGVLHHFDHWSFSDEVGVYKPDRAIFRHALDGLGGVEPIRAVHVGDLRRTDVRGAKGIGMTALRYRGVRDDLGEGEQPIEGDHVLDDHADLLALLGLERSDDRPG
ncbi:MAG: HAD family hydrolase [Acidimicrobiales bacterium]